MFINEYAYELVLDTNFYKTFSYYKYLMVCQTYLVSFIKKKNQIYSSKYNKNA